MLSTPKSNAKRNGEKKNMKGEGKLKKESLKRRTDYPPIAFQLNKKGQEKQTKEQRKRRKNVFSKRRCLSPCCFLVGRYRSKLLHL